MAYIGKQPAKGNFVKLDTITTSATTTFNLLNGGVAYFPQSANNCLVSLNGILQAPTDSYTISGSTIIFSSALTTSDVIDFIIVLGDVLSLATVSDSTIGLAKLTATGTPSSSTFLRGDNSWASAGGNNTPSFFAYLSGGDQTVSDAVSTKVTINAEVFDSDNCFDSTTNYRFTPTTAGKYFIFGQIVGLQNNLYNTGVAIYKNGSYYNSIKTNPYATTVAEIGVYVSGVVTMNGTTDYVELYGVVDVSSGTPKIAGTTGIYSTLGYLSYFGGYKLIGA
jgi:hypothetical protein